MPVGAWFGNRVTIYMKPTAAADAVEEAFWASPIFDLQPQLRGLNPSGVSGNANGNGYNAVPIWGGAGRLHIQLGNLRSSNTSLTNIKLSSSEFAHISDPSKVVQALATSDITSQLQQETKQHCFYTTHQLERVYQYGIGKSNYGSLEQRLLHLQPIPLSITLIQDITKCHF